MAVLAKIRQRSLLLILVIGFCLFAFIIGDVAQSGGFNTMPDEVGVINGDKISYEDFRLKVDNTEKSRQGITSTQAVNNVWEQEITIALLKSEFEKLGLQVGEDHIIETLSQSPDIGQDPAFRNEAGIFDVNKFKEFYASNPELQPVINSRKKDAELNAKYLIYNTLIKSGLYTTNTEAKLQYAIESDKVSFDFVAVPYSSVNDSEVTVSDDEIIAFMKKNVNKYKADETRELQYIIITDIASAQDKEDVQTEISKLLDASVVYNNETKQNDTIPGFKLTNNIAEFVASNSDIPYDSTFVPKNQLPAEFVENLYNLPQGEIFGPYEANGYYFISKSLGRKNGATARASHILIAYEGAMRANPSVTRSKEDAAQKANELLAQAQANPSSFMMLAMTNSDDSSKQQGGDLGFFSPGQMTPKFNDFVFNNNIGKIGLVETEFGYHIINVTDKQDGIKLATIAKKIEPSAATVDGNFAKAVQFEMDVQNKDFESLAKENSLEIAPIAKVKILDENIGSIQKQRQIVKWVFDKKTDVGDVKRYEIPSIGHVILKYKKVNKEGLMALDVARPMVETQIKNEKKAALIKAKMNGSTLDAIAKTNNVTVQSAIDVTLSNAVIPGAGREQKVVGTAFNSEANKISKPIEGVASIYVVQQKSVTKAEAATDLNPYITQLNSSNGSGVNRAINALKENAEIKDNRHIFY